MRKTLPLFAFLGLVLLSCQTEPRQTPVENENISCLPSDVPEANLLRLPQQNELLHLTTASTGQQLLRVYTLDDCTLVQEQALPADETQLEYSYQLADINYSYNSQLIGLHRQGLVYLYDMAKETLSTPLPPSFSKRAIAQDAQSGTILRLEVWEHFLIGYAEDLGTFAFDLSVSPATPILPQAQYDKNGKTVSLFMIPSNGDYQAILPEYDPVLRQFSLSPVFDTPKSVQLPEEAPSNERFFVLQLKENQEDYLAVDLVNRQQLQIPTQIMEKGLRTIRNWLAGQEDS